MRLTRLGAVVLVGVASLSISLAAVPQNPPPPPPPPPPTVQGGGARGGVVGGVVGGIPGGVVPTQGRSTLPPAPLVTTGLIVGRVIDPDSGRGVSGAIVTLNGGPTRTVSPPPPGSGTVQFSQPPPPPQILTDAEGRFAFRNLTRGNYSLNAAKNGYAAGAYGRMRPNGPNRSIQLGDGEKVSEVLIRVFKLGAISGTVTDEAGEPVVSTNVRAYRRVLRSGRRVLTQAGGVTPTDDRGAYRISNLVPGEYVIVVPMVPVTIPGSAPMSPASRQNFQQTTQFLTSGISPSPGIGGVPVTADGGFILQRGFGMSGDVTAMPDASGRLLSFATQYYPAALTVSSAESMTIASGEQRGGVDIALRRVPTAVVSGQIFGPDGPGADFALRLVPSDAGEIANEPEAAVAMADGQGRFMFSAVPAGQYVVQAVRMPRQAPMTDIVPVQFQTSQIGIGQFQAQGSLSLSMSSPQSRPMEPLLWAMAPVSVGDTDVHGISLMLREGLTISGRLEFSGSRPRPEPQRLTQIPIVVEGVDGRSRPSSGPSSRVQADGRFVTDGQLPGKYFLRIGGAPAGWIVDSISVNGVDAMDTPIELSTASLANAVVTFTDLIPDVRGNVRNTATDADPPAVIVFPADSQAWKNFGINPSRMRMTRAGATGAFGFGPLPSGEYFATAIPEEYSAEWQDPAYLELLARTATRFSLAPGERRTLDIAVQDVKPPAVGRAPTPAPAPPASVTAIADPIDDAHGPFAGDDGQQVRDTRPPAAAAASGGSISGVVRVDDGTMRPARYARVSVRGGNLPGERSAFTDNEGRFSASGLPAGTYQISASKASYLTTYYGARRPQIGPGRQIKVDTGQAVSGIDFALPRGGVISGSVIGPDGEPLSNARIQVLQRAMVNGERSLTNAPTSGPSVTDDRGMFRVFGLRPGSYVVSVIPTIALGSQGEVRQLTDQDMRAATAEAGNARVPSASASSRQIPPAPAGPLPILPPGGTAVALSPVYYPGTPNEDDAGVVVVAAGQEVSIGMSLQYVQAARLEGRVVTPDGQLAPQGSTQVALNRVTGSMTQSSSVRMLEDGKFLIAGVAPGRYTLTARHTPPVVRSQSAAPLSMPVSSQLWAQQEVDVGGVDLSGLMLALGPTMTLSGRIVFEGGAPPKSEVQVRLDPAGRVVIGSFARVLRTGEDGTFTITGITPGRFRLNASVLNQSPAPPGTTAPTPPTWAIKSGLIGGRDAFETTFEVQANRALPEAVITMTTRLPELAASIEDQSGRPITDLMMVLFSADRGHWAGSNRRIRSIPRPGEDGSYKFTSMLPGDYYLAVVTDLEPGNLTDPEFLEQLVPSSIKIALAEGDKKTQKLRIASGTSGSSGATGTTGARNLHF